MGIGTKGPLSQKKLLWNSMLIRSSERKTLNYGNKEAEALGLQTWSPFSLKFVALNAVETHATKWHKNKACWHAINEKLATSWVAPAAARIRLPPRITDRLCGNSWRQPHERINVQLAPQPTLGNPDEEGIKSVWPVVSGTAAGENGCIMWQKIKCRRYKIQVL